MLNILPGMDPEKGMMVFKITGGNLLSKYYNQYKEMIVDKVSELPEKYDLEKVEEDQLIFAFPIDKKEVTQVGSLGNSFAVGPKIKSIIDKLWSISEEFIKRALATEFQNLEFIPLEGYPFEQLKDDLKRAQDQKRDFCIISDFKYMDIAATVSERGGYKFPQFIIPYKSEDYYDVICMIWGNDKEGLKKFAEPRLKDIQWY